MNRLEQELGFRVTNSTSCLPSNCQVEILTADGTGSVKAVRPATLQEADLWNALLEADAWRQQAADASADAKSMYASNEAYREQLERLYQFLKKFTDINELDDAVQIAMEQLQLKIHNESKRRLEGIDARSAKTPFGDASGA